MTKKEKPKSRSKEVYHLKNWSEYDQALVNRYSLTLWISEEAKKAWKYRGPKQRGGQYQYSDAAIETMLTIKELFQMTNRGTEGFVRSLFELMGIELAVPDHTTLSTRGKSIEIKNKTKATGKIHLVVDSSGLKLYGEGEWTQRKHGKKKRRTWRKMHLMMDPESWEIVAAELTEAGGHDSTSVGPLLEQIEPEIEIDRFIGDGGYDTWSTYDVIHARAPGVEVVIPPRKNAKIKQHGNSNTLPLSRDESLRAIRRVGRKKWKQDSGYHQRSLVETAMSRMKTIFSGELSTRSIESQTVQLKIRTKTLNTMTTLGMPDSYKAVA